MSSYIPKTAADFETILSAQAEVSDTSITLSSVVDVDGNNLAAGLYAFTLDGDTIYKEFIIGTLSGSTVSSVQSISAQGAVTTGIQTYHRRGASVAITDWVAIGRLGFAARGEQGYDGASPLFYDVEPTFASDTQIVTKKYVDDLVNGGTVSYNQLLLTSQTAGENLSARDHVYFKESDQRWYKVDADLTATFDGLKRGYAAATQTTGNSLSIVVGGLLTGFVGLTAGSKYYASNTAGAISATPGTYTVYAGTAATTTSMIVDMYVRDIPTGAQKDALAGSQGVPNSSNKYETQDNASAAAADQSQITVNGTSVFGAASTTGLQNRLAQSFIPSKTKIRGVNLYKQANTGTFTGTVTIALQADSAGSPSGVDLATVTLTNAQWLSYTVNAFQALFSAEYQSLVVGNLYWIVARTSTADTSNHPNLGINTAGGYASGSTKYFNTTDSWVAIPTIDLYFETLEGDGAQLVKTNASGFIPDPFFDKDTLGFNRVVGALPNSYVKTFYNAHLLFTLWTGSTSGAATTDFANWLRTGGTVPIVPALGTFVRFGGANSATIYVESPFYVPAGTLISFASSNILVMDFFAALDAADDGVFMGFIEDGATGLVAAYNSTTYRRIGFAWNGSNLYAVVCDGTNVTTTQILGITNTVFNDFRISTDLGADTASFYINSVLVATVATTFPTANALVIGFGKQDDAQFTVSAPYVAVEMNP